MRQPNGKYRVFGRATDAFQNNGKTYAMYAIEEKVLELPAVAEAEVVKYEVDGEEYPAIFIVLNASYRERACDVLKEVSALDVDE